MKVRILGLCEIVSPQSCLLQLGRGAVKTDGQLLPRFYKKTVATKLWGRVMPKPFFPIYLMIVMAVAHLLNEGFVKNKA